MSTPRSEVESQNESPTSYHLFSSTRTRHREDAVMGPVYFPFLVALNAIGRTILQLYSNRKGPVWLELEQYVLARCVQYLILDNRRPIGISFS